MPLTIEPQATTFLTFVLHLYLGFFILSSSIGKFISLQSFVQGVVNYDILPNGVARIFGAVFPFLEFFIGLCILFGFGLRITTAIFILMLFVFIYSISINIMRGRSIECNCYSISGSKMASWGTVARNIILLVLSLTLFLVSYNILDINKLQTFWINNIYLLSSFQIIMYAIFLILFFHIIVSLVDWLININSSIASISIH